MSFLLFLLCLAGIWSWVIEPWTWEPLPIEPAPAVKIERFDRVLDEYVSLGSYTALHHMNTHYPRQTKLLIEQVLQLGRVDEPDIEKRLRTYYLDSTVQVLLDEVHRQYSDLSDIERRFSHEMRILKNSYPDFHQPHVYAQISCLHQSIVVADTLIGISLDKYLGADFPIYQNYYSEEQRRQMVRDSIVSDAIAAYKRFLDDKYFQIARRRWDNPLWEDAISYPR